MGKTILCSYQSSPAWGRGLKFIRPDVVLKLLHVVPRVGTWIEMESFAPDEASDDRRPPRGDVD